MACQWVAERSEEGPNGEGVWGSPGSWLHDGLMSALAAEVGDIGENALEAGASQCVEENHLQVAIVIRGAFEGWQVKMWRPVIEGDQFEGDDELDDDETDDSPSDESSDGGDNSKEDEGEDDNDDEFLHQIKVEDSFNLHATHRRVK